MPDVGVTFNFLPDLIAAFEPTLQDVADGTAIAFAEQLRGDIPDNVPNAQVLRAAVYYRTPSRSTYDEAVVAVRTGLGRVLYDLQNAARGQGLQDATRGAGLQDATRGEGLVDAVLVAEVPTPTALSATVSFAAEGAAVAAFGNAGGSFDTSWFPRSLQNAQVQIGNFEADWKAKAGV